MRQIQIEQQIEQHRFTCEQFYIYILFYFLSSENDNFYGRFETGPPAKVSIITVSVPLKAFGKEPIQLSLKKVQHVMAHFSSEINNLVTIINLLNNANKWRQAVTHSNIHLDFTSK